MFKITPRKVEDEKDLEKYKTDKRLLMATCALRGKFVALERKKLKHHQLAAMHKSEETGVRLSIARRKERH